MNFLALTYECFDMRFFGEGERPTFSTTTFCNEAGVMTWSAMELVTGSYSSAKASGLPSMPRFHFNLTESVYKVVLQKSILA